MISSPDEFPVSLIQDILGAYSPPSVSRDFRHNGIYPFYLIDVNNSIYFIYCNDIYLISSLSIPKLTYLGVLLAFAQFLAEIAFKHKTLYRGYITHNDTMQLIQCATLYEILVFIEEAKPEDEKIVTQDISYTLALWLGRSGHGVLSDCSEISNAPDIHPLP